MIGYALVALLLAAHPNHCQERSEWEGNEEGRELVIHHLNFGDQNDDEGTENELGGIHPGPSRQGSAQFTPIDFHTVEPSGKRAVLKLS